ncbi:MAG: hypothetical protein K9G06_00140 [Chitinophagaceae bacterium]|jgi:hypothetical protein|nr:hypothetical protein [Chitinophagaceae bacterium]
MKKIFIPFILMLVFQTSQAQLLQLQDPVSSKNFNPDKYAGIRGTPLFQDKWIHGSVVTTKGIYPDLELKIDLYDNILFFNKEDASFELLDQIISVKLFPKWPDTIQQFIFVKGMNQNGLKPEQYVQALVGAGAVQLYRSDIKQVTEMSEINAGMIKTFANTSRYYIKKGDLLKLIKLNKEELMSFLMDKEAEVNAAIEAKRLNLKKESDIIQLIQAYNKAQ